MTDGGSPANCSGGHRRFHLPPASAASRWDAAPADGRPPRHVIRRRVPALDRIPPDSLGDNWLGASTEDLPEIPVDIPGALPYLVALRVQDDGMYPTLLIGDLVVVAPLAGAPPDHGDLALSRWLGSDPAHGPVGGPEGVARL